MFQRRRPKSCPYQSLYSHFISYFTLLSLSSPLCKDQDCPMLQETTCLAPSLEHALAPICFANRVCSPTLWYYNNHQSNSKNKFAPQSGRTGLSRTGPRTNHKLSRTGLSRTGPRTNHKPLTLQTSELHSKHLRRYTIKTHQEPYSIFRISIKILLNL